MEQKSAKLLIGDTTMNLNLNQENALKRAQEQAATELWAGLSRGAQEAFQRDYLLEHYGCTEATGPSGLRWGIATSDYQIIKK